MGGREGCCVKVGCLPGDGITSWLILMKWPHVVVWKCDAKKIVVRDTQRMLSLESCDIGLWACVRTQWLKSVAKNRLRRGFMVCRRELEVTYYLAWCYRCEVPQAKEACWNRVLSGFIDSGYSRCSGVKVTGRHIHSSADRPPSRSMNHAELCPKF